jgi:DNA repair photolyase
MQSADDWLSQADDEEVAEAYRYFMRPDPGMMSDLGPIETVFDPITNREMRWRYARVGMLRNVADEHKKDVKVWLDPIPHIRQDKGKDLQGWYQGKQFEKGSRPRPCLLPDSLVMTPWGDKQIQKLQIGDVVIGYDEKKACAHTVVEGASVQQKSEYLLIELANERTLRLTPEHQVFTTNRGWVEAKDLTLDDDILPATVRYMKIKSITRVSRETDVWDIQTGTHNFFAEGVLVHNCETDAILSQPYGGHCSVQCPFCLREGELVDTPTGQKRVEALHPGDFVWGRANQGVVLSEVMATSSHWELRGYYKVQLNNGQELCLTPEHPLYSVPRQAWVATSDLRLGEQLEDIRYFDPAGLIEARHPTVISSATFVPGGLWVYDIQTTTENFYHNGVLSHNCYLIAGGRGYRASRLVTVPLNYGTHVRKQLSSMKIATAGYFSSFNDPFLPVEAYYHNTQEGVQAFLDHNLPVFFLSRLAYPDWAIDALRQNPLSYAQKSINTPDEDDWRKLSPGAITLAAHFDEIRKLKEAGAYVSIQCNPVIAGIVTHEDIERLFDLLADAGTDHVIVKYVEANHPWAGAMVERLTKKFGDNRAAAFRDLFTENSCGGQKTVQEEYRREGARRYRNRATELGMTFSLCYEYTRRPDGIWKSMGPEFLTADQCHGRKVPMHVKSPDGLFRPLADCPPHGCLRCADDTGKGKCGSSLLGEAKALRLVDLKKPFDGIVRYD